MDIRNPRLPGRIAGDDQFVVVQAARIRVQEPEQGPDLSSPLHVPDEPVVSAPFIWSLPMGRPSDGIRLRN